MIIVFVMFPQRWASCLPEKINLCAASLNALLLFFFQGYARKKMPSSNYFNLKSKKISSSFAPFNR
jgi:hypothetical protein